MVARGTWHLTYVKGFGGGRRRVLNGLENGGGGFCQMQSCRNRKKFKTSVDVEKIQSCRPRESGGGRKCSNLQVPDITPKRETVGGGVVRQADDMRSKGSTGDGEGKRTARNLKTRGFLKRSGSKKK